MLDNETGVTYTLVMIYKLTLSSLGIFTMLNWYPSWAAALIGGALIGLAISED